MQIEAELESLQGLKRQNSQAISNLQASSQSASALSLASSSKMMFTLVLVLVHINDQIDYVNDRTVIGRCKS